MPNIEFSGDDLAIRVPLLGQFREHLIDTVTPLVDISLCRWAGHPDGDDEITLQASKAVHGLLTEYVLPAYGLLGESVGVQGEKLGVVGAIGQNTEDVNGDAAGGWGGGRHG
jgi:hypothetical protein